MLRTQGTILLKGAQESKDFLGRPCSNAEVLKTIGMEKEDDL